MTADPNIVSLAIVSLGVGWLMAYSGLQKSALELKRRRRVCPSCGRHVHGDACGCTR